MHDISLKHNTSLVLISLWTMGFQQWKNIHQIRLELTWNLLNSFQDLNEIKGLSDTIKVVFGTIVFLYQQKSSV